MVVRQTQWSIKKGQLPAPFLFVIFYFMEI